MKGIYTLAVVMSIILIAGVASNFSSNPAQAGKAVQKTEDSKKIYQQADISNEIHGSKNHVKNIIYQQADKISHSDGDQTIYQQADISNEIHGSKNHVKNIIYQQACQSSEDNSNQEIVQYPKYKEKKFKVKDENKNKIIFKIKQSACTS